MRTINKSRNFLAYALLSAMALACIFTISGPSQVMAGDEGSNPIVPDTIPVEGGGDTSGHGSSIGSGENILFTFNLLLLVLNSTVL